MARTIAGLAAEEQIQPAHLAEALQVRPRNKDRQKYLVTQADPNIERWRRIRATAEKLWVLFRHDTCAAIAGPQGDLAEQARALLREWRPETKPHPLYPVPQAGSPDKPTRGTSFCPATTGNDC